MHFRTDGNHIADLKAQGIAYDEWYARALWDATPIAELGDTWRLTWYRRYGHGPIAGYAICCPLCRQVHYWTTARNCTNPCPHQGNSSCWTWTGSAEENRLSASPSLYCVKEYGGCGWHGFLTDGVLRG
jgi:hypothetical protein